MPGSATSANTRSDPDRRRRSEYSSETLIVRPWFDPLVGATGQPIGGTYVELFWLGVLGPTATWLLRRLVVGLEPYPEGYEVDLSETAAALGLRFTPGQHGPFVRALERCTMFGMTHRFCEGEAEALAVRLQAPLLRPRQVERLPPCLRRAHDDWIANETRRLP